MASPWGQLALPTSSAPMNAAEWSELKAPGPLPLVNANNPDGRSYYYNSRTNATTWEKPDALKTPAEICLAKIPWKEYTTPEGRKYWNNSETGESVWSMPQAYKDAVNGPAKPNGYRYSSPFSYNRTSTALTLQTFIPAQREIEDENTPGTEAYHNKEEAKKDFIRLLRKTEMEPTSQWNEVLPQIIKNPAFRGVKDPVERKQLFENYLVTLRTEVQEKEKDRRHRVREGFMQMCRRHPEIKHYTRYKTARPILQEETDFKACKDDDERRELFEEFRVEALQTFEANETAERTKAMKVFREILESLELEPYARWRPTKELFEWKIKENNRHEELWAMNEIDYLTVFEDYVKGLEKEFNDVRQAEKDAKYRAERKNREGYIVRLLLTSLTLGLSTRTRSGRYYY
jgi:pre-mRNA-processing factor 40